MCDPVSITAAVVGLAGTAYSVSQQKKVAAAQRESQERIAAQSKQAQDEANRLAAEANEQAAADSKKTTATNVLFQSADSGRSDETSRSGRRANPLFDNPLSSPSFGSTFPTLGA